LFANPKQASAIPARPTPNLLSACRRYGLGQSLGQFIELGVHGFRLLLSPLAISNTHFSM
jgi:hypothetical protein